MQSAANRIGQVFGQYRLENILGGGGFATVYLAKSVQLSQMVVAVKVLNREMITEKAQQFKKEAATILTLNHPHIIRFYQYDVYENATYTMTLYPYIVMEHAPNGSLYDRHKPGTRLDLNTIKTYIHQIGDALQYAHGNQVMHLDVKPANILINRKGDLFLSDFGLATLVSEREKGAIEGTLSYMAPEQLRGRPDKASDQYALGIMIYQWLCGRPPFTGTIEVVMRQQLNDPPPPLRSQNLAISPEVEAVVMKALSKDAKNRYESITQFVEAFERAADQSATVGKDVFPQKAFQFEKPEKFLLPSDVPSHPSGETVPDDDATVRPAGVRPVYPGEPVSPPFNALPSPANLGAAQTPPVSPFQAGPPSANAGMGGQMQPVSPFQTGLPSANAGMGGQMQPVAPFQAGPPSANAGMGGQMQLPALALPVSPLPLPTNQEAIAQLPSAIPSPGLPAPENQEASGPVPPATPFQFGPPPANAGAGGQMPPATPFQFTPPPANAGAGGQTPPDVSFQPGPSLLNQGMGGQMLPVSLFQPGLPSLNQGAGGPGQSASPFQAGPPPTSANQGGGGPGQSASPFQAGPPPASMNQGAGGPGQSASPFQAGPPPGMQTVGGPGPQVPPIPPGLAGANLGTAGPAPQAPPFFPPGLATTNPGAFVVGAYSGTFNSFDPTVSIGPSAPEIHPFDPRLNDPRLMERDEPPLTPGDATMAAISRFIQPSTRRNRDFPLFRIIGILANFVGSMLIGFWLVPLVSSPNNEDAWWGFIFSALCSIGLFYLFSISGNRYLKSCLSLALAVFWGFVGAALDRYRISP